MFSRPECESDHGGEMFSRLECESDHGGGIDSWSVSLPPRV